MSNDRREYLEKLRRFWEVEDPTELKFNRVDTLYGSDRTDEKFDEGVDRRARWALDGLALPARPCIVEIGCGIGAVLKRVIAAHPEAEVWGFDISSAMVAEAARQLGANERVHLVHTTGDSLDPVSDGTADLVICSGVFIHFRDIALVKAYLREAERVLKPGGFFRFNVRFWNPEFGFSAGLGGALARLLYRIGWYSSLRSAKHGEVTAADFNGITFQLNEVDTLTRGAGFLPSQYTLITDHQTPHKGYVCVNCTRDGAPVV